MRPRFRSLLTAAILALSFVGLSVSLAQGADSPTISGTVVLPIGYSIDQSTQSMVTAYEVTTTNGNTSFVRSYLYSAAAYIVTDGTHATYEIAGLDPAKQYVVVVDAGQIHTTPLAGFMTSAYGGYVSLAGVGAWDANDPTIVPVTPTDKGVDNIDIVMTSAPTVSGKITPATAANKQVRACEISITPTGESNTCHDGSVGPDGSYVAPVSSGATVEIGASADGYLTTWFGGYSAGNVGTPSSGTEQVTQIPIPADGSSVTGKNIDLTQGASISGTVSLPEGYERTSGGYASARQVLDSDNGPTVASTGSSGSINADGTYTISSLVVGQKYVVYASADSMNLSAGNVSDLLVTAFGGYLSTSGPSSSDLGDPSLQIVTAQVETPNVDMTMGVAARITGTVDLPNDGGPATVGNVYCYEAGTLTAGYYASLGDDGTYTCKVIPGRAYSVAAYQNKYVSTWLGGYAGRTPVLPDPQVAETPVLVPGQTLSGQDITLHDGSSISGKLIYTPAPETSASVGAYALQTDGDIDTSSYVSTTANTDGSYTITGVEPGKTYAVVGVVPNYLRTWYGGFVGFGGVTPSLPNTQVMTVLAANAGGEVTDIDITLVRPATITGSIQPPSVLLGNGTSIYACPTYTNNGQSYYRSTYRGQKDYRGSDALPSVPTTAPQSLPEQCEYTSVDSTSGTYSVAVIPGVDYALIGVDTGHENAWYGGYFGAAGIYSSSRVIDRLLPSTDIKTVSGQPDQTVEGVDIVFAEYSVTFEADGGSPETRTYTASQDGTVALPSVPARAGYQFDGWYTLSDGKGEQFTKDTVVDQDTTVYAKWSPVYTLTYNGYGSEDITTDPHLYAAGDKATVEGSLFTRDGYTFSGWGTAADGSGISYAEGDQVTMTSDLALYARWTSEDQPISTSSSTAPTAPETSTASATTPGGSVSSTTPVNPSGSTSSTSASPSGSTTGTPLNPSGSSTPSQSGTSSGSATATPTSALPGSTVTAPSASASIQTGGTSQGHGTLIWASMGMIIAGVLIWRIIKHSVG